MYDVSEFSKPHDQGVLSAIDSANGANSDVTIWVSKYRKHLSDSGISSNTIALYSHTLNALLDYCDRYLKHLSGLSQVNEHHFNDFLEWIEQYSISKLYGSKNERIDTLVKFLNLKQVHTTEEYRKLADEYYSDTDDSEMDVVEYVIEGYYKFLTSMGMSINKESILLYKESGEKVSLATMGQRRIALIAFLNYIDNYTKAEHFVNIKWKIKRYTLPKHANELCTGFDKEDTKKIVEMLSQNPATALLDKGCVQKNSEYCEWRNRAMIVLMMGAGLRSSEALNLKFTDITEGKNGTTYVLKVLGKGNKIRRVPIKKSTIDSYLSYLNANAQGEYLSSTRSGVPMSRGNLYEAVSKLLRKAGVSKVGLHIFRHHFGSTFASLQGNMKVLQQLLGHVDLTTTMIYSQINDEVLADAVLGIG